MKNLKRILSLVLASVMVMGMMVVGASAAFNDQAEINPVNVNAVNTMVSLKIISGKEGNQFDPKGNVTRAEMATMIAMALNGGNADFRGTTTTGFTDVDGVKHWAAKFIKYCVDQGILSGVGGGKFNPDANVTAQEAATMVLTAMGYKKQMLASETSDWAAKINLKAEQRKLYDDTAITDYTETIDRETAAQMIFNGITVGTPEISDQYNTTTGEHMYTVVKEASQPSILTSAFKAKMEYAILAGSSYNANNGKFTYTMSTAGVTVDPLVATNGTYTLVSDIDVSDLFQQKIKIIYSDSRTNAVDEKTTVIGITSVSDCVLSQGVVGDMDVNANRKTIDGFGTTNGTGSVPTYAFNGGTTTANDWDEYKLIDNNDDGKADCIVAYAVSVAQVRGVTSSWLTTSVGRFAFDANTIASGLTEGDWITVKPAIKVDNVIEALEPIENVTATAQTKDGIYTIGGEAYASSGNEPTGEELSSVKLGSAYNLVAVNGYIFSAVEYEESTAAAVKDVVLVTKAATAIKNVDNTTVSGTTAYHEVIIMGADGKTQIVKVSQVDTKTAGTLENVANDNLVEEGNIYTYKTTTDGYYKLTGVAGTGTPKAWEGYDEQTLAANTTVAGGKTSTGVRFRDNALVYVVAPKIVDEDGNGTFYAVTGAEINKWDEKNGTKLAASVAYTKTSSGFPYAELALLVLDNSVTTWPGTAASSQKFGYLTANTIAVYDAATKTDVAQLTIWNGEETVTRTATLGNDASEAQVKGSDTETALATLPKGTLIAYKENEDGKLAELKILTMGHDLDATTITEAVPGAVTAYDPARPNDIQIMPTQTKSGDATELANVSEYDLENTVVIYIDDAKKTGTTGSIQMAMKDDAKDYVNNVYAVVAQSNGGTAGDTLVALFVDVNNEIAKQIPTKKITTKIVNENENAGKYTVKISGDGKEGEKIIVTVTQTAAAKAGTVDTVKLTGATFTVTDPKNGSISSDTIDFEGKTQASFQFTMGTDAVEVVLTVTNADA